MSKDTIVVVCSDKVERLATYRGNGVSCAGAFVRVKDARGVLRTVNGRVELDIRSGRRLFIATPGTNQRLINTVVDSLA